jgi:crossover junction endodeoxyribonuclease RuvC
MSQNNSRILAIDPGTRLMGVALLEKGQLIYHGVKVIKKGDSSSQTLQNARRIVLRLINDLRPDMLVVEKAFFAKSKNVLLLKVFIDEIKAIARRKQLKLISYSPNTVRKFICGNGWADKYEVSQAVAQQYPELRVYLTQDRAWKERFHQNMFDAVALGIMAADTVKMACRL